MSVRYVLADNALTELRQAVEALTRAATKVKVANDRLDPYAAWMDGYATGQREVERWLHGQITTERTSE